MMEMRTLSEAIGVKSKVCLAYIDLISSSPRSPHKASLFVAKIKSTSESADRVSLLAHWRITEACHVNFLKRYRGQGDGSLNAVM